MQEVLMETENLGKNSIIGAGSMVTNTIQEGVIVVGSPCRVVRQITENDKYAPEEHEISLNL